MDTLQNPEASVFDQVEVYVEPANTGRRFVNFIVDLLFSYLMVFGLIIVSVILIPGLGQYINESQDDPGFKLMDRLVTVLLLILVYTFIEGVTKGRTIGKLLTGTKAVREDGNPITWKDALVRSLIRFVPFDTLSGFSGYPWHDKWSHTQVVRK